MRIHLSSTSNLYLSQLSGDSVKVYNALIDALSRGNLKASCHISDPDQISRELTDILLAVCMGNPEIFFIQQCISPTISGDRIDFDLNSIYEVSTLSDKYDELVAEVERIVGIIKKMPDKYNQIYRLNEYLCMRITGCENENPIYGNAYGALINCQARCEGFAKAAKMILDRLGFENEIITGEATHEGETVEHAWNAIKVDGHYYYFDFTWDGGYSINQQIAIPLYTFLDRNTMLINHKPKLLVDNDTDDSRLFYKLHNGEMNYLSDLSNAEIIPYDRHYFSIVKLPFELSEYEKDHELYNWVTQTFGHESYGIYTNAVYADGINCAIIYFFN